MLSSLGSAMGSKSKSESHSESEGESQQSSMGRQAVLAPTPEGISRARNLLSQEVYKSEGTLGLGQSRAQGAMQPFATSAEDALNELRLLSGLAPVDPLQKVSLRMRDIENMKLSATITPSQSGPTEADPRRPGMPFSDMISPGMAEFLSDPTGVKTGTAFDPEVRGRLNRNPTPFIPFGGGVPGGSGGVKTPDQAKDYPGLTEYRQNMLFDSLGNRVPSIASSMTMYNPLLQTYGTETYTPGIQPVLKIRSLMGEADNTLDSILNSKDSKEREQLSQQFMTQIGAAEKRLKELERGDPMGRFLTQEVMEMRQAVSGAKNMFSQSFKADAPRPLTEEELNARIEQTPGYQARYKQGLQAVERSKAAAGLLRSGNFVTAAQRFGQDLAQQTLDNERANLMSMVQSNTPLVSQSAGLSSDTAKQIADLWTMFGGATAEMEQNASNRWLVSPPTQLSQGTSREASKSDSESKSSSGLNSLFG